MSLSFVGNTGLVNQETNETNETNETKLLPYTQL